MKKAFTGITAVILLVVMVFSFALTEGEYWYCSRCKAYRNTNYCSACGAKRPNSSNSANRPPRPVHNSDDDFYDMGIPDLHGQTYKSGQMNLNIYWVQVQLKATGVYYQGDTWDETGNLGDHTMEEIASFMRSRGYSSHNGQINQTVINELAAYLGRRIQPVYIGGFYRHMDNIMHGGHTGNMEYIISNLRDMVPHVTVGARWIQCCLKKLGYYSSTIDGKYGENTENAVRAFQRASGFEERDYVSLGVARAMLEQCYYAGCSLNDLDNAGASGGETSGGSSSNSSRPEISRGWVSECDVYFNPYGLLCFDMTKYKPKSSSVITFFRNDHEDATHQGSVSEGLVFWESFTPGWVYECAIWCGQSEYVDAVISAGPDKVPASAWIRFYVTDNREIHLISSSVTVHIQKNQ